MPWPILPLTCPSSPVPRRRPLVPRHPGVLHPAARLPARAGTNGSSAGQQLGQGQSASAPAQGGPKVMGPPVPGAQGLRQGIKKPLAEGQVLLAAALGAAEGAVRAVAAPGRGRGQGQQGLQMVEKPRRGVGPGTATTPPGAGRHPEQRARPTDDPTAGCPSPAPPPVNRPSSAAPGVPSGPPDAGSDRPSPLPAGASPTGDSPLTQPRSGQAPLTASLASTSLASATPSADPSVSATTAAIARGWPPEALDLAQRLQRSLSIDDRQWHRLKGQRARRAAEQLSAALVQLLAADDPRSAAPTRARQEAIALADHALGWLRAEVSDPGCPSHGR